MVWRLKDREDFRWSKTKDDAHWTVTASIDMTVKLRRQKTKTVEITSVYIAVPISRCEVCDVHCVFLERSDSKFVLHLTKLSG